MIFKTITDDFGNAKLSLNQTVNDLFNGNLFKEQSILSENDINCLKAYNAEIKRGVTPMTAYYRTMQDASDSAVNMAQAARNMTINLEQIAKSSKVAELGLKTLSIAGNMLAMWFISKGIELAVTSLDKFINATKHAAENAQALSSTMNNSISSISGNVSKLSDLNNEYQELSRGVNKLGENVSLSTDDYSRYKDIISRISDIMPNLTTYFNAQGEKIAFAKGQLSDLNQEYDKYIQNQAVKYVSEGDGEGHKIQDILNNYNYNQYDDLNGFQKFWSGLKNNLGFVEEKNFTAKEIINELEKLRAKDNIQEIYEYLQSYDKNFYGKPDLNQRDSAVKYMLLNELGLSGKDTKEILEMTEADYNALMQSIIAYIDDYNAKIMSDMNDVRTSLLMQTYSKNDYWKQQNEDVQNDIISFLSAIDSDVWEALNIKTEHDMSKFVNNIIDSMSNNTGKFADAWNNLFNPELTNLSVDEYVQQINNLLKIICDTLGLDEENGVQILKVAFGFDDVNNSYKRLQNSIHTITDDHGQSDQEEYAALSEFTRNFTQAQIELWLKSTQGAENAAEAVQMYKDELKKLSTVADTSISQTIDRFNTRLTPAFDSLKSAYQNIFTTDGFNLDAVDISMLAGIKSDIEALNNLEDAHINIDMKAFDYFVSTLTNTNTTEEQARQAFNDLATSIFYATNSTEGMTGETQKLVEQLLTSLGVTNASAVAEYALQKSKAQSILTTYDLIHAKEAEFLAILGEGEAAGLTRQAIYSLTAAEIAFGNNNLNAQQKIEQLKELATAYGDTTSSALATAIANDLASGHTDVDSAINDLMSRINSGMQKVDLDFSGLENTASKAVTPSTQTKETFNWIERAIKRVQEALARLTKIRDNTFKTWGERNDALQSEIAATTHELQLQAQAHYKYLELADAIPLDDYHKALVQSGAIDLETVTDSNLKELISEYEDFYQKAVDAYDAVEDLQRTLSQLAKTRFDSVLSQFNNELSLIESRKEQLDNSISNMETRGYAVSTKLYEELALSETKNLSKIRAERDALLKSLNDAVTDGSIQAYSEEWYNMAGTINDVTAAMQKSQTQLTQYQNTLKELNWENFKRLQKTIGRIVNESDFMIDLLENETLTSGTGTFTDEGLATVGLHAVNYNTFMAQADRYAEKLRELHKELANDPYNQTLIDKERELQDAQRDSILSAEQEKQAMVSLSRNAIQEQINALEKLIDKKKESLHTEKDLYEFQKTITEKTKAITDIKKQLSVAKLDTSEEGKQRLAELQNRLKNAEEDLKDTQYDRWIKEQETLLDNMMAEYETLQNELSENTDLLLKDLISMTNENASAISDTIRTKTDELGITLSEELETIFNGDGSVKNIVSIYSDNFNSHMTTLQDVLNGIEQKNKEMIAAIDNLGTSFITAINTAAGLFNTNQGASPTLPENGGFNAFNQTSAAAPSSPAQGQRVDSANGIWYSSSAGAAPSGNVNHFAPDYFIVDRINPDSLYPYHIQAYINGKAAGGSGWVKASQIGYKDGLRNAQAAHLAWTQEDGGELIYRKSDHALFTPIGAGDAVFTRQMSDNLWNMAKGTYSVPEPYTRSLGTSQGGDVIISIDKMNLPDVTNPQQFASRFVDTLKNDSKVQSAIRSVSVDLLAGRPKSQVNTF